MKTARGPTVGVRLRAEQWGIKWKGLGTPYFGHEVAHVATPIQSRIVTGVHALAESRYQIIKMSAQRCDGEKDEKAMLHRDMRNMLNCRPSQQVMTHPTHTGDYTCAMGGISRRGNIDSTASRNSGIYAPRANAARAVADNPAMNDPAQSSQECPNTAHATNPVGRRSR